MNQSVLDLTQSCDELIYLVSDALEKLQSAPALDLKTSLHAIYAQLQEDLEALSLRLHHDTFAEADILEVYETLQHQESKIRTYQGVLGNIITAADWQSPAFAGSGFEQAGRQNGKISMGINDYKRDLHAEGIMYEQSFRRSYITSLPISFIKVYATSSGMAAFTTIVEFLRGEKKLNGPILVGKSSYFESKNLLLSLFPNQIIEVEEHNLPAIQQAIETLKPAAIFLDSVCSSPDVALPNIPAIVEIVRNQKRDDLVLVIDNTGLATMFQPLKLKHLYDPHVQIIVWESLLKYHQFGMDRVNGGIIYSSTKNDTKLYDYRDHLGTNISDAAAVSLPSPNYNMLTKRLLRHERNAQLIANSFVTALSHTPHTKISNPNFPGLSTHPAFPWSKPLPFHGSLITLTFQDRYKSVSAYKNFLTIVLKTAKAAQVNVIGGSSFGLSTTRIYVPASYGHQATPFLRIAAGTEPLFIMQKVVKVLEKTILSL